MINNSTKTISIIVRTKNESRWIRACLRSIRSQEINMNIEIVLVDNKSSDKTLELSQPFVNKVCEIDKYRPGLSINLGIKNSKGEYIVILSGHCIPKNKHWLRNLISPLEEENIAGVYGRQVPFSYSEPSDKRDLEITFGLDKRYHIKDAFFHNANSAFKRETLIKYPFDENLTNIEDREWAKRVISQGMINVYEPSAEVYHWHGIHHSGDQERASKTLKVLETINANYSTKIFNHKQKINLIIPFSSDEESQKSKTLFKKLLIHFYENQDDFNKNVFQIIFSITDPELKNIINEVYPNALIHLRSKSPAFRLLGIHDFIHEVVIKYNIPDFDKILYCDLTYVFRPEGFLKEIISNAEKEKLPIISYIKENRRAWTLTSNEAKELDKDFLPSSLKETSLLISCLGLGSILNVKDINSGCIIGSEYKLNPIENKIASFQIKSYDELHFMEFQIDKYRNNWTGKGI